MLIGDSCIDEYHYGSVNRISPEAPVPIFVPNIIEHKKGMAENVEQNLKKLGVKVISYFGQQSIKIRIIDEKTNQQLIRIDNDLKSNPLQFETLKIPSDLNAFIVSDYEKGFVSYELVERLIQTNIPVFVDTKKTDLKRFDGAIVKINFTEYTKAKTFPKDLIVTMGKRGAKWNEKIFDAPDIEIIDVCGAGDTFLASFSFHYIQTKEMEESIKFAIKASSITVKHRGVYSPSLKEILC